MTDRSRDSKIIDFSAHFYPNLPAEMDNKGRLRRVLRETEGPIYRDFEATDRRISDGGLDGAVFSQPSYLGNQDLEVVRTGNDNLLETVQQHGDYYGLATIPIRAGGDAASHEFERCLEGGFNGGAIETWSHERSAPIEALEPVLEVADRYGAPLFLHPKVHGSIGDGVFDDAYRLNAVFGRGAALSVCIYTLIQGGYFDSYPDVNVVAHHMGGNIAGFIGRIRGVTRRHLDDGAVTNPDEPPELVPFEVFTDRLADNVYVDTAGFDGDPNVYRAALDGLSAENVLLGTDYPCEVRNGEDYRRHLEAIEAVATPEEARRILGENALELLINTDGGD